ADAHGRREQRVQVRIGVQNVPKELVVETDLSADEIQNALPEALSRPGGIFALQHRRAGRIVVPGERVGYLELSEDEQRSVGFVAQCGWARFRPPHEALTCNLFSPGMAGISISVQRASGPTERNG